MNMDWQTAITAALVLPCTGYSVWTLMPTALRQRCRAALGRASPATEAGACGGCDGCGSKKPASKATVHAPNAAAEQVVTFVRRKPGA